MRKGAGRNATERARRPPPWAQEPARPNDRHRRNDRRRFVSWFGRGDPESGSGIGRVLRHWRIGHVLHHARPWEPLLYRPVSGSFASYAEEFVGPWAGFVTGWSYWFMWVVIGMAEITAVGVYIHYWLPGIPQSIPALITLGLLYTLQI